MRPPDFIIGPPDDIYLERWHLLPRNRWFNVYLHHFLRSDDDRALHDHPYVNMSILLRGAYLEQMPGERRRLRLPWRPWAFWRLTCRLPTSAHRVELIDRQPVWTLFITGPRVRNWGFLCPKGWVPHERFAATPRPVGQHGVRGMSARQAKPQHEAFFQDLNALLKKHAGHLTSLEMLAVASNLVGKLVALQDQQLITPGLAMKTVSENIQLGNQQVLDQLLSVRGHG